MFKEAYTFDGTFQKRQEEAVPRSLLALVSMMLSGANIKEQAEMSSKATVAALTVSQVVMFNSVKHSRPVIASTNPRHNRDRETPLSIYLAMKCHALTRSRSLVDTLFHLGLCVSYDRLLQLTAAIANGVLERFETEWCVHQSCAKACSPPVLLTTSTITQINQQHMVPSMAQLYRPYSTRRKTIWEVTAVYPT